MYFILCKFSILRALSHTVYFVYSPCGHCSTNTLVRIFAAPVLLTLALLHRFLVGSLSLAVDSMHYCERARASSTHVREVYVQFEISLTRIC